MIIHHLGKQHTPLAAMGDRLYEEVPQTVTQEQSSSSIKNQSTNKIARITETGNRPVPLGCSPRSCTVVDRYRRPRRTVSLGQP